MAGLGSLDELYNTFLGQTTDAVNAPAAPWQQELMETVNPEKVRRQNAMRALAAASAKLATTPGNFLTGIAAAAGTGADSYLTAQQDAEQQRVKAMQLVQAAQQQQQDRRLQLLMDAIGVNRNIQSDKRADDEVSYRRGRDKIGDERQAKLDERQAKIDDARINYWNDKGTGSGSSGSASAVERRRGQAAQTYYRWLDKYREDNAGEEPPEDVKDSNWQDILKRFKVDDSAGDPSSADGSSGLVVHSGDTTSPTPDGIIAAPTPPPLEQRIIGKVYATQKGNFIWTGQGWKPAL